MKGAPAYKAALVNAADNYISRGWKVFLCGNDKKPLQQGGFKNATADLSKFERALIRHPDGFLSVRTGAASGIVVIDIDVDEAKQIDGRVWLNDARVRGLPECPTVETPRGGLHLYFAHPGVPIPNSAGRLAKGIDVRADGGYAITPPSESPKGAYRWKISLDDLGPPLLPDWLQRQLVPRSEEQDDSETTLPTAEDHPEIDREVGAALTRVSEAKEGSRNDVLNRNAFLLGRIVGAGGLDRETALASLINAAEAAGLPSIEAHRTAESGLRAGVKRPWRPRAFQSILNEINRDHFYCLEGRVGFVFREERDSIDGRQILQPITPSAFRDRFGNRHILIEGARGQRSIPVGEAWMKWAGRRQYDKIVFAPGKSLPPEIYNQWQGFAAQPVAGVHEKWTEFLREVVCAGDADHLAYLEAWLARAVQEPWKPGEVAIVLRGEKGTGKTFFADHFGELFGEHYVQMSSSHHLVGNFNAHLEGAVVVFADEAFWAGDKQGEGTLKTLITGRSIRIERKGIDSKSVPNHIHMIMASNSDWVVPASADERRYFVLDVSGAHRQDHQYFADIDQEWQGGGRESFMYTLTTRNLAVFNVRLVPTTDALADQKLLSMPPTDRWYLGILRTGTNRLERWDDWVSTDDLWANFNSWTEEERARSGSKEAFGMRLAKLVPGERRQRLRGPSDKPARVWGYEFPNLDECRRHFELSTGISIEWCQQGDIPDAPPPDRPPY